MSCVDNYLRLKAEVARLAKACGRSEESVQLLVVSKTRSVEEIKALYDAGVREFAENREPELAMKKAALPEDIVWHFIGPVQSNKVRKIVNLAQVVHSIDSAALAERFDRIAKEEGKTLSVFLEVSISGEECKGGVRPDGLDAAVNALQSAANLKWIGLMTMAPLEADDAELKAIFSGLQHLEVTLKEQTGLALEHLSMGMSGDYAQAIACGSTIVRIGTAVFA